MRTLYAACLLCFTYVGLASTAYAAKKCPTQFDPGSFKKGNFFTNFDNNCYWVALSSGNGSGSAQGDLNSVYYKIFFQIDSTIPQYQLVLVDDFPNARYLSIVIYDEHSAVSQSLSDVDVAPLTSAGVNPFLPGVAFVGGQRFAVPVNLGGTPSTPEPGCVTTGYNVNVNALDGTQRHQFMNWNLDDAFWQANPTMDLHQTDTPAHSNPNAAGSIVVRNYLDLTPSSGQTLPHIIVRDVASGCAYPATVVKSMDILTTDTATGNAWLNQQQVQEHSFYEDWQPSLCWGTIPSSQIQVVRSNQYTPAANPDSGYLYAYTPSGLPLTLASAGEVLRLRFRVPTTPPTPCTDGCMRTGSEQMRYMSVSFETTTGGTLASLPDSCPTNAVQPCTPLIQDVNGYVTLVVGTGTAQPYWVTPANGYTWLDLTKSTTGNYQSLYDVGIRNILPSSFFNCSGQLVPYSDGEATTAGAGLMGLYSPVIDYPVATELPPVASPVTGPGTCQIYPAGPPQASPGCAVGPPESLQIGSVTTQCAAPGCSTVVVQSQPPLSISTPFGSGGFGFFPLGLPYTGYSDFLQITDTTQNWSAGYIGDACTVRIGSWSDTLISLVANVNYQGACPIAAGDQLAITVWNPQTMSSASSTVTVQP